MKVTSDRPWPSASWWRGPPRRHKHRRPELALRAPAAAACSPLQIRVIQGTGDARKMLVAHRQLVAGEPTAMSGGCPDTELGCQLYGGDPRAWPSVTDPNPPVGFL